MPVVVKLCPCLINVPFLNFAPIFVTYHNFYTFWFFLLCLESFGSWSLLRLSGFSTHVKNHYVIEALSNWDLLWHGLIHAFRHSNKFKCDATLSFCHSCAVRCSRTWLLSRWSSLHFCKELSSLSLFLLLLLAQYFGVLLLFLLLLFLQLALFLMQSTFILFLLFDVIFHNFSSFLLQLLYLLSSNVFILPFLSLLFILQMLNVVYWGMRWLTSLDLKLMIRILLIVVVEGTPLSAGRFFLGCILHVDYLATVSWFDIQRIKFLKHFVGSTDWVNILLNLTLCFGTRHLERLVPIGVCFDLLWLRLRHLNCVITQPRFATVLTFLVIDRTLCRLLRLLRLFCLFRRLVTIEAWSCRLLKNLLLVKHCVTKLLEE